MAYQQQQQQSQHVEHGREPCPDRILDDIGGAFGMGALGGGLWHTYRGLKNSPKGYKLVGTIDVSEQPFYHLTDTFTDI
jgi:import inner membrane translocase subunit TIM17